MDATMKQIPLFNASPTMRKLFMVGLRTCRTLQLRGCRCFSLASNLHSGHNRWSKIKNDKAKVDVRTPTIEVWEEETIDRAHQASVTKQRSALAHELQIASKQYGADPQFNPHLASTITAAKKQGLPKASIESAIARGQGRSITGAVLESLTIEAMVPPSVAVIVECQTDSKLRTLNELKTAIRYAGGTITPTSHMFDRRGKIVFEASEGISEGEIFDQAVEAGAIDVQTEEDGKLVIYTETSHTTAVADTLATSSGLKSESSDIVWVPKEDMMVDVESPETLENFLGDF